MEDQIWRLVYGFPLLLQLVSFLAVLFYYTEPSIIDLLQKWDTCGDEVEKNAAFDVILTEFRKIYVMKDGHSYEELARNLLKET